MSKLEPGRLVTASPEVVINYVEDTKNREGRTNYLTLSDDGSNFYLMNIIIHDLSHDVTNDRLNKKIKVSSDLAKTISDTPSSDSPPIEIANIDDLVNKDLATSPHFDTILNVGEAIIILEAAPVAGTPPASAAKASDALPPATEGAKTTKAAKASGEFPPPVPTTASAAEVSDAPPPAPEFKITDTAMKDTSMPLESGPNSEAEDRRLVPEVGLGAVIYNANIQPGLLETGRITRSKYRKLQRISEFVDETKMVVIGKIDDGSQIGKRIGGGAKSYYSPIPTVLKPRKFDSPTSVADFSPTSVTDDLSSHSNSDNQPEIQNRSPFISTNVRKLKSAETRKLQSMIQRKLKSAETRKLKSAETRKLKSAETRKLKSMIQRKVKSAETRKLKSALMRELKSKPHIQRNIRFNNMLKSAFHQVVGETNGNPEYYRLNKYYRVMFELYSSFKPSEQASPLDIFNLSFIKEALILHLIYPDVKPSILLDAVIKSRETNDPELKGGGQQEQALQALIRSNSKFNDYKALYINFTELPPSSLDITLAELKALIDPMIDQEQKDSLYNASTKVRKNVVNGLKKTIGHNEKILEAKGSSGRPKYIESVKKTLITCYLKILFDGIYDACERAVKEDVLYANRLAADAKANSMNMPIAKIADKPCKIVRTIARGFIKYVLPSSIGSGDTLTSTLHGDIYTKASPSDPDKSLFNSQVDMVRNIAGGYAQGGETLDSKLLNNIREYLKEKTTVVDTYSKPTLPKFSVGGERPDVINNGARSQLPALKLNETDVICPLSSILDPMGSFGSCSTDDQSKQNSEKAPSTSQLFPTDIHISNGAENSDGETAYYGRTEQKLDNMIKKGIIQYGFRTSTYALPIVIKVVDMTRTNIIDLSVSNTYESILNRIVFSWNNLTPNSDKLTVNELFELLIRAEGTFTDLISCSTIKNCGDLYQEINSAFVNRGYDKQEIKGVIDPRLGAKALFFRKTVVGVHQDRPAAVRNMFLLSQDSPEINKNAYGGYVSPSDFIFVKHK